MYIMANPNERQRLRKQITTRTQKASMMTLATNDCEVEEKRANDGAEGADYVEPQSPGADRGGDLRERERPPPPLSDAPLSPSASLSRVDSILSTSSIEVLGTDNALPQNQASVSQPSMAPPTRARSLPKTAFASTFSKLKTSTYTDTPRPSSTHNVRTLSWNAPGTLIATGAHDRTLRIWNPEKTQAKYSTELRGHGGSVERVSFHPINETELASCGSDGTVRFWDVRSKASVGEVKVNGEALYLAWKPDGSEIVAGTKDNILIPISRSMLTPIAEHRQSVQTNQCVFNWSGNQLYVTDGDGCVKILRYPSLEHAYTLSAHTSSCRSVSMSPSGAYLAIGGSDALVSLWDTQEWICVRTLEEMSGAATSVDFSFDGSYVVAGSDEGNRLSIAHSETGDYVYHIDTTYPAAHVAWHPCRYVLAYSAEAQGLRIVGGIGG